MSFLRKIEKGLDSGLRGVFGGAREDDEPREAVELHREALDLIAARVVAGKRGERVFPFNAVHIELRAETGERRAVLEAFFGPGQMVGDVRAALAAERASVPEDLAVTVEFVAAEGAAELRVVCDKVAAVVPEVVEAVAAPEPMAPIPVVLRTLTGVASEGEFVTASGRVNVGRERDVVDAQGRAVRRNDLWFDEGGHEANATVSRIHAHLAFDGVSGEWRIYDDGSSLGTYLFRGGRRIDVPGHGPRGVMVLPGDEIYLGQARLRVEIYRG